MAALDRSNQCKERSSIEKFAEDFGTESFSAQKGTKRNPVFLTGKEDPEFGMASSVFCSALFIPLLTTILSMV